MKPNYNKSKSRVVATYLGCTTLVYCVVQVVIRSNSMCVCANIIHVQYVLSYVHMHNAYLYCGYVLEGDKQMYCNF